MIIIAICKNKKLNDYLAEAIHTITLMISG